jgi:hypothetical protein
MALYDYPHPRRRGRIIRGYDRPHALRTARMSAAVALRLGYPLARVEQYQIACLLHDLGRAGLDRRLFGRIWTWAKERGIPTRPREWRAAYPETPYGAETEAFVERYKLELEAGGVSLDDWAVEQVEMRLGYARRLVRRLRAVTSTLSGMGIRWRPWMTAVTLYYYYPEKLIKARPWVKELAEILVACEQFEAYSNRQRGRDYYARQREPLSEAFAYLEDLNRSGLVGRRVIKALSDLCAEGAFDVILAQARGMPLSRRERAQVRRRVPNRSAG